MMSSRIGLSFLRSSRRLAVFRQAGLQGPPPHVLRHATGYALANAGHNTDHLSLIIFQAGSTAAFVITRLIAAIRHVSSNFHRGFRMSNSVLSGITYSGLWQALVTERRYSAPAWMEGKP